jgi:PhnB protein
VTASDTPAVKAVPDYLHTVTARLVVADGGAAIDFYVEAFGATQIGDRFMGPGGELIHAEIQIGDSVVMITGDTEHEGTVRAPDSLGFVTALLCLYWEDVDIAWARAVAAGAEVVYPLENQFYGERGGRLRDPFGQQWMMSQHVEDVSPEEMKVRARAWLDS